MWLRFLCVTSLCYFKKKTIWTMSNQSIKTKQNSLQELSTVKERPSNSVCVWCWEFNTAHFLNDNQRQEMVLISELKKERMWSNYNLSQQSNCCLLSDAPPLSFEWAENLCVYVSLWLSGRVMMESLLLWSRTLYVMIHTVNGVPLLAWWENRDQSPTASYNQFIYSRSSTNIC